MDVLWRDRAPAAAANNLHQAVHVARRALGADAIEVRDEVLSLAAEVDVDALERGRRARRAALRTPAAYRAALALYGGELLPENRYDDWAETRRDELATLAAELARRARRSSGRRDGVRRCRPMRARSSAAAASSPSSSRCSRRTRLLTLAGTGGVGKTRLALELARGAEASYAAGAALVELAPLTDPRLVPDAVAAALDVRALPGQELGRRRRRLPRAADAAARARQLRAPARGDRRARGHAAPLGAAADDPRDEPRAAARRRARSCSASPRSTSPTRSGARSRRAARGYEAVPLFVERAAAAAPGFALDEENADDVARICFRLDGLPLALELAAGAARRARAPPRSRQRLDDRFRLLRSGSHAAPTRQQTLTATLQWSHDLLEPDERVLLPAARGLRRRLRARGGRGRVRRRRPRRRRASPTCSRGSSRSRSSRSRSAVARAPLPPARDRPPLRARAARRGRRDEPRSPTATPAGRSRSRSASAARRGSTARRANLRAALDTLLAREPDDALRLCVALLAVLAAPDRARRGAAPLRRRRSTPRRSDTRCGPRRCSPRRRSTSAAARSPHGHGARARRAYAVAVEIGDARARVARAAVPRRVRRRERRGRRRRARGSSARSSSRAARASPPPEAIGVYSLGVAHWIARRPRAAPTSSSRESIELFRALDGSPEHDPLAAQHRRDPDEPRSTAGSACGSSSRTRCSRSSRSRCDAAVGYALANQAGDRARARRPRRAPARCSTRARARFEAAGRRARAARRCSSGARTSSSPRAISRGARAQLEAALELRARLQRPARRRARARRASA